MRTQHKKVTFYEQYAHYFLSSPINFYSLQSDKLYLEDLYICIEIKGK